jgi:hypothetical protein
MAKLEYGGIMDRKIISKLAKYDITSYWKRKRISKRIKEGTQTLVSYILEYTYCLIVGHDDGFLTVGYGNMKNEDADHFRFCNRCDRVVYD